MNFPDRLQEMMIEKRCTKYRLAKELKMSATTIANYLNEKTTPDITKLEEISRFLGVNRRWLFNGEGEQYRPNIPVQQEKSVEPFTQEQALGRLIALVEKQTDILREQEVQISRLIEANAMLVSRIIPTPAGG
jgi:transcriptional regulator with XRE-family HTH domain